MRSFRGGTGLTGLGVCGYVLGVFVTDPGREFSLSALMIGLTLVVIERGQREATP